MSDKINQILWSPDFAPSSMMILLLKRLSSISSLDTFIFLAMSILSIFFSHCFDGLRLFFLDCPLLQATIVKKDNRTSIKRNLHHCPPFLDFIYLFFLSSLHLIQKILKSAADYFSCTQNFMHNDFYMVWRNEEFYCLPSSSSSAFFTLRKRSEANIKLLSNSLLEVITSSLLPCHSLRPL